MVHPWPPPAATAAQLPAPSPKQLQQRLLLLVEGSAGQRQQPCSMVGRQAVCQPHLSPQQQQQFLAQQQLAGGAGCCSAPSLVQR
jgi:hypothetical protein